MTLRLRMCDGPGANTPRHPIRRANMGRYPKPFT
jgi:hypothetical protein